MTSESNKVDKNTGLIWRARTPAGDLTIELRHTGFWYVVLEDFSRSANRSLEVAIAEATGARRTEGWLQQLVREIGKADLITDM